MRLWGDFQTRCFFSYADTNEGSSNILTKKLFDVYFSKRNKGKGSPQVPEKWTKSAKSQMTKVIALPSLTSHLG